MKKLTPEQRERLNNFKSKYYVKYVFMPKFENFSESMPFSFNILKEAALRLKGLK